MLKSVRKGSSLRWAVTSQIEGWKSGARRKTNGMRGIGAGVSAVGAIKVQSSASRRSAEPEAEVDARLPCCTDVE